MYHITRILAASPARAGTPCDADQWPGWYPAGNDKRSSVVNTTVPPSGSVMFTAVALAAAIAARDPTPIPVNCSVLYFGIGIHGDGAMKSTKVRNVSECCAMAAAGSYDGFTFHNSTSMCNLNTGALNPHVSAGTADATSGCRGPLPPHGPPAPGPAPPSPSPFPPAAVPPSQPVMPAAPTFKTPPRPNIVLFFGDDIGYGDLGAFGNPTSETPALDTMAADGAKLVQYYSAACICSPSRGALMTGAPPPPPPPPPATRRPRRRRRRRYRWLLTGPRSRRSLAGSVSTGRTFGRIGVYPGVLSPLSVGGLPLNETTVAEKLKTVGYVTAMCGKWREYAQRAPLSPR